MNEKKEELNEDYIRRTILDCIMLSLNKDFHHSIILDKDNLLDVVREEEPSKNAVFHFNEGGIIDGCAKCGSQFGADCTYYEINGNYFNNEWELAEFFTDKIMCGETIKDYTLFDGNELKTIKNKITEKWIR